MTAFDPHNPRHRTILRADLMRRKSMLSPAEERTLLLLQFVEELLSESLTTIVE